MTKEKKILQLTLISIGLALVIFTYFLYPKINKPKVFDVKTVEEKIDLQKEIEKLEKKAATLTKQIEEAEEYLSSGGMLKKDILESLQTDLQDTSSSLVEEKWVLEEKERNLNLQQNIVKKLEKNVEIIANKLEEVKEYAASEDLVKKDILKNLKKNLQKKSSSLIKEKLVLEESETNLNLQKNKIKELEEKAEFFTNKMEETEEYVASGGVLKKDFLEDLQEDLQEVSSSLARKKSILEKEKVVTKKFDEDKSSTFKAVEYEGLYDLDKPFTIKSESAYIVESIDPNLLYMENMHVTIFLENRTVIITSDKGRYNKYNYNIFFEKNVIATDGETEILAENLDLLSSEDSATIYNNVYLTDSRGTLQADRAIYDFTTKFYKIKMDSANKRVKVKFIQ